MSSVIGVVSWPPAHPEPWMSNDVNTKYADEKDGYANWLIRAPVPAYTVIWPVPCQRIAKFLKRDWWQAAGPRKYGHRALRILPYTPDGERDVVPGSWSVTSAKFASLATTNDIGDLLGKTLQSRRLASFLNIGHQWLKTEGFQ